MQGNGNSIHNCTSQETVALLGIAYRKLQVVYDPFKEEFRARIALPTNIKPLGDYLLIKRIEAKLTQQQVALYLRVAVRKLRAWERSKLFPTGCESQRLADLLHLELDDLSSNT